MRLPLAPVATAGVAMATGMAWAVRGRASTVFGPSVWRGQPGRKAIALTFDDGPSPGTSAVLDILHRHDAVATFFQCGVNVERNQTLSRQVALAGHEIGNHSHTHPLFAFRSPDFIRMEFGQAQKAIENASGFQPTLVRAPYGVRWYGFREMQQQLGLRGVMWSTIASDWRLPAAQIVERVLAGVFDGAIICLHDGRGTQARPDTASTVSALGELIPQLLDCGWHFETVSRILTPAYE